MLSDVMEDYLKAIYVSQSETGPPVSTSEIADRLDKTPPTVTSMVEKLTDRGLVTREKYKGVELTDRGETIALEVLRHHRLLEAYLAEQLNYSWDEVHEEADALEHHISEEFERRVAETLGDPTVDPHGDPIPGADLQPPGEEPTIPLSACEPGDRAIIARVSDRDEADLAYLADAGVTPGTVVAVTDVAPFGMVTVAVGGEEQSLPESVAESIRVTAADHASASDSPDDPNGPDGRRPGDPTDRDERAERIDEPRETLREVDV